MQPEVIRLPSAVVSTVFTTDWHFSDIPPGRRTSGYVDELLTKVEAAAALAQSLGGVGLCGGDVFHIKSPTSHANSFALERRISLAMQRFPNRTVYGAIGNHDLWQDRMDSLPKQPLGSLIASQVYHDLTERHVIFENADATVRVLVEALPYYADDAEALAAVLAAPPRPADVTHRVLLMHQYGHTGGEGSMFGHRTIGYEELAEADYDVMLWGHDHSREKTAQVGNVLHVRLGSLARASLAGDEVNRPVSAAILGFSEERVSYKEHLLPTKPLELAFVAADRAISKVHTSDDVTEFFSGIDVAVAMVDTDVTLDNPREVIYQLAGEDKALADFTCELCHF